MKNIIVAVVVVFCILAGSFGGKMLKSSSSEPSGHAQESGHADKDEHGDQKPKKNKHGDKMAESSKKGGHGKIKEGGFGSSEKAYFKFGREFVVPIMQDGKVKALVILNLNLEVDDSHIDKLFSLEPKLRDNVMTTLVGLSTDGRTLEDPTNTESYETIRSVVLMNLQSVVSSGIENVLILDMAKQDL